MSRNSHLPPRCPFHIKNTSRASHGPLSPSSSNYNFTPRHQKSVSQSFILEEQPPWFDEILSEKYENTEINPLRRSVSDPVTILGSLVSNESSSSNENGSDLESSFVFGPNSPRSRGSMDLSENNVVSKLTDYFSRKPTDYYLENGVIVPGIVRSELVRGAGGSVEVANLETTTFKRHSGQRSRVRKLQYIAELERTVNGLQSLESELAIKVASLLQHRVALSIENNTLKQQLMTLTQEKVFVEGQYRSLKNELERLKNKLATGNKSSDFRPSFVSDEVDTEAMWQMLKIGKLNINQ